MKRAELKKRITSAIYSAELAFKAFEAGEWVHAARWLEETESDSREAGEWCDRFASYESDGEVIE
jgi:hypothetical protein